MYIHEKIFFYIYIFPRGKYRSKFIAHTCIIVYMFLFLYFSTVLFSIPHNKMVWGIKCIKIKRELFLNLYYYYFLKMLKTPLFAHHSMSNSSKSRQNAKRNCSFGIFSCLFFLKHGKQFLFYFFSLK